MLSRYPALVFFLVMIVALGVVLSIQSSGMLSRFSAGAGGLEGLADTPLSDDPAPILFTVKKGESTKSIAERLEKEKIIRSGWFFSSLAQLKGVENELKAGEYELRADMRPSEILTRLQQGVSRGKRIVIPEGWRATQVADLLEKEGIAPRQAFLDAVARAAVDTSYGKPPGTPAEGYLFPDTYVFPADITPEQAVALMLRNFDRRVEPPMVQKARERGQSFHQALTIASIVEREAIVASERPLIASVYYNRLKAGMPLQADPTVQYAVASAAAKPTGADGYWKKDLTKEDLDSGSLYNTYRRSGLPPGPIANPGLPSIRAALEPAESEFLFFMARPDGSHVFSRTFEEHLQNVARFRPGN